MTITKTIQEFTVVKFNENILQFISQVFNSWSFKQYLLQFAALCNIL